MDTPLTPCPSCERLLLPGAASCPWCEGAPRRGLGLATGVALLGLGLTACTKAAQDLYGVPDTGWVDEDGDGFDADEDCDDADDTVYPGAEETPDDGVDSNCDGEDNT